LAIFDPPLPYRGFSRDPPLKKTRDIFEKSEYLPAGCLRHKRALVIIIICYILSKKSGTMSISQCESRMGKEKVIANEEKGQDKKSQKDELNLHFRVQN